LDNITSLEYIKSITKRQLEATTLGAELLGYLRDKFAFTDYEYSRKWSNN
jgi:hypothetical protein